MYIFFSYRSISATQSSHQSQKSKNVCSTLNRRDNTIISCALAPVLEKCLGSLTKNRIDVATRNQKRKINIVGNERTIITVKVTMMVIAPLTKGTMIGRPTL